MKKRKKTSAEDMDINFFNAVSYELAGEIGVIDNEDMIDNKKLPSAAISGKKKKK